MRVGRVEVIAVRLDPAYVGRRIYQRSLAGVSQIEPDGSRWTSEQDAAGALAVELSMQSCRIVSAPKPWIAPFRSMFQ